MDVSRAIRDAGKRAGYGAGSEPQFVLTFVGSLGCFSCILSIFFNLYFSTDSDQIVTSIRIDQGRL